MKGKEIAICAKLKVNVNCASVLVQCICAKTYLKYLTLNQSNDLRIKVRVFIISLLDIWVFQVLVKYISKIHQL